MSKKLICLALALVILVPALAGAGVGPVGWWKLDETTGTTVADSSVNKNHGTLQNGPTPTTGQIDGAFLFDATDDYISLPIGSVIATLNSATFTIWANYSQAGGAWQRIFDIGTGTTVNMFLTPAIGGSNTGVMRFAITIGGSGAESQLSAPDRLATGWHHIAVAINAETMRMEMYLDGVSIVTAATARLPKDLGNTTQNWLGRSEYGADAYYSGSLDEFRIYDRVLTPAEIADVMGGGLTGKSSGVPVPANGATDVSRDVVLGWTAGELAKTHNVYLGTSSADGAAASASNPLDVLVSREQDATTFAPGRLELGQTYYWRVDEVNAAPDKTVFKGTVWSFTVEPYSYVMTGITATASSVNRDDMGPEKTIDGSGLVGDQHSTTSSDMWLSNKKGPQPAWIQYDFNTLYKLDKMLVWNSNQTMELDFGLGAKDVAVEYSVDGSTWTSLGDFEFAQAPGVATYTGDIVVDFAGIAAKAVKLTIASNWGDILPQYGLSEVQFYYIPVAAREPSPADDAGDVHPQVQMTWRAGREADSHKVYVGTDEQAVADGAVSAATVSTAEYETSLMLDTTYYWKVAEVNNVETPAVWDSGVWSFTTAAFVVADDFEGYTDDLGNRIYEFWSDGWEIADNGSIVGYAEPPFAEQAMVHTGKQSMPFDYDNTKGVTLSEAKLTLDPAQDWTRHGFASLVLYFRGLAANTPAPLYIKINDTKISYNNGAVATAMPVWKQWTIPLAASGANLKSVKSLTIGVGGTGTGTVYFDDLRLYAVAPEIVAPVDPGTTGLVALYAMDGNVNDSSGKNYNGTLNGDASYETGYSGQALIFNGINAYVDLPIGALIAGLTNTTVATHVNFGGGTGAWQRVFDFGAGTTVYMFLTPRLDTGGVMRFAIRTATVAEQVVDGPVISLGWHHMAIAIDSTAMTLNLYLDGERVGSAATTLLPKDLGNTTQNWIGRSQWEADAYYTGSVDDFRIYNRVLSEAEVRYLAGDR
jgi:hypothetical protein